MAFGTIIGRRGQFEAAQNFTKGSAASQKALHA